MAEPVRDPETGGRSLADILREAGIENPSRGRKRRWDDDDDAGIRQRRADAEEQERSARVAYGRRAGDLPADAPPARPAERAGGPGVERPAARVEPQAPQAPAPRSGSRSDDRDPGGLGGRARHRGRPDGGADGPPSGPAAWLRFAGELVVAAAVGVGVYFAFTVLWEMLPHLAVVASPLVVTGLVAGVGAWRQRSGRGPLGIRLLALLVFAGTVLTILPAAGLLAAA